MKVDTLLCRIHLRTLKPTIITPVFSIQIGTEDLDEFPKPQIKS